MTKTSVFAGVHAQLPLGVALAKHTVRFSKARHACLGMLVTEGDKLDQRTITQVHPQCISDGAGVLYLVHGW